MGIGAFFGKLFGKGAGQLPVVGPAISVALDLGAAQWVADVLTKSISRIFKIDEMKSTKLINAIGESVKTTSTEISKGSLTTPEEKQLFAANEFRRALADDPEFSKLTNLLAVAPLLIELVYQLMKLKNQK